MVAVGLRARRLLTRCMLLTVRVARRHYFSMLSAAVLTLALSLTLTSSSLDVDSGVAARTSAGSPDSEEAAPASRAAAPVATATAGPPPTLVYYMLGSERQRYEYEMAIQADVRDWYRKGLAIEGSVHRHFIVVTTPEEEFAAMQYLNDLFKVAQAEGVGFYFFDLR